MAGYQYQHRGSPRAQRAGFLPHSIASSSGLVELVPIFGEVSLGALRSSRFVVGAGDRAASSFLDFGESAPCAPGGGTVAPLIVAVLRRHPVNVVTIRDTEPLVALINAQLAQSGAEFVTSMAQPAGPFGAVVFGSIDDHAVRLEFFIEPATNMCAVHLFEMITKKVFVERVAAPNFEKAIEGYPWAAAIDMLGLS